MHEERSMLISDKNTKENVYSNVSVFIKNNSKRSYMLLVKYTSFRCIFNYVPRSDMVFLYPFQQLAEEDCKFVNHNVSFKDFQSVSKAKANIQYSFKKR